MNFFANGGTNCGCGCNDYILILLLVCCCGCNICDILPWLLIMNCCGGHGVGCCKQQANKQKKHSLASAFFVVQVRYDALCKNEVFRCRVRKSAFLILELFGEICHQILNGHSNLCHCVTLTDGDGVVFQGVKVNGHAERCADFVLTTISLAD